MRATIIIILTIISVLVSCKQPEESIVKSPALPAYNAIAFQGSFGDDNSKSVITDTDGNLYITGYFSNQISFGNISLQSTGKYDIFIAKYDKKGLLLWAKSAGGFEIDLGRSIAVDNLGNVYITGDFYHEAYFDKNIIKASNYASGSFLAKYNADGIFQWAKTLSKETNGGSGVITDKVGNIYVTSGYYGNVTIDNITIEGSESNSQRFLAKFNEKGTVQWLKPVGNISFPEGHKNLVIDNSDNIYMVGIYNQAFGIGNITTVRAFNDQSIIIKFDNQGNASWVKTITGESVVRIKDIAIDNTNNLYITGIFLGKTYFENVTKTPLGVIDLFFIKYNQNGVLQTIQTIGELNDYYSSSCIDTDNLGNFYVVGYHIDSPKLKPSIFPKGYFVTKYTSESVQEWVKPFDENNDYVSINGMKVNGSNNVFLTGYYVGNLFLDNNNFGAKGSSDIFLLQLRLR